MPWFYVDDGFSDSKPVMDMPDRHRLAACGLWVLAGSWSAKEELDGFVPDSKLRQLRARPSLIDALTDNGPMSAPLWTRVEGGIVFNSWEKWQKTRAELNQKRREDAERQRKWREANPDAKTARNVKGRNAVTSDDSDVSRCDKPVTDSVTEADSGVDSEGVSQRDSRARAPARVDPTRPDPTRPSLVETYGGGVTEVDARNPGPRPQCHRHVENSDSPCPDCKRRREWDEAQDEALAELKRRRRKLIDDCPSCDDFGRLDDLSLCPRHPSLKDPINHQEVVNE